MLYRGFAGDRKKENMPVPARRLRAIQHPPVKDRAPAAAPTTPGNGRSSPSPKLRLRVLEPPGNGPPHGWDAEAGWTHRAMAIWRNMLFMPDYLPTQAGFPITAYKY